MVRRSPLRLLLAMVVVGWIGEQISTPSSAGESKPSSNRFGVIRWPNVTGAAMLPGDRLLLTSSTDGMVVLPQTIARLQSGKLEVAEGERLPSLPAQDLQDVAVDRDGTTYLVTSHSRTPRGEAPAERYRLLRLRWTVDSKLGRVESSDALLQGIVADAPFLADAIRRPPARAGLDVEGLACSQEGDVLVGLRSPTVTESVPRPHGGQEDAVVVRIRDVPALFEMPTEPAHLGETVKLDLRGMGIRGMARGSADYWLLTGLSVTPNYPVKSPWALWRWDGVRPPILVELPNEVRRLEEATAVCPLQVEGQECLLITGPAGEAESRYVLLPTPRQ